MVFVVCCYLTEYVTCTNGNNKWIEKRVVAVWLVAAIIKEDRLMKFNWRGTFFTLLLDSLRLWGDEGEFLAGVFCGLVVGCEGVVTSQSEGGAWITETTGGGEIEAEAEVDTQAEVEAKGSEGASGLSTGTTLRLFGGVCLGVGTFPLIGGNIVLVLGFLHPYVTPIIFIMLVCLPLR